MKSQKYGIYTNMKRKAIDTSPEKNQSLELRDKEFSSGCYHYLQLIKEHIF